MAEPGITEPESDAVKENTDSKSDRVETMAESHASMGFRRRGRRAPAAGALIFSELFRFGGRLPEAGLSGYEVTGGADGGGSKK